ncbi:nucleotide exchange factor GrpE [Chlamydia psittaci]|uniref:Protein GrpE n=1 Tax=Chlamydia psittaci 99DC5 TaxID=1112251 RepID=A0ABN0MQA0_CHLPS|nr:nucleotide exchange factor GrpE [Chlamydia psittaci]AFS19248.1 grpE family protein [Chlamydia psittaci 84/55]AFS22446.1 grpE family protein [Chlamydia psittaci VS225]EPJ16074.1 grpE family protein [Chlamydia psittaci 02DC18]EPJ17051.1 grpE family protein [Chlamydia psittaci 02DC22]EPJ19931.1 grpE family protein [Chlamydia psittaci 02DC23]EPJ21029.1 grpE family protein [Chlamydia psittaci 02DC21]EPJ24022.1 grpE family protein [Chlamydia psittaci 03DC29]EPJ25463.1 grpE family protein [Chla
MTDSSNEHEAENSTVPTPDNEIQDLQQEIATLKAELKEKNDKYLMVLAESENARKRMQKERQEMMQYAVENALIDFLVPIESMEKALGFASQMSDEVKNWALGFNMILQQFKQVFEEKGIVEYSSVGQKFNPFLHEAVETEETTKFPEGTVVEEFSKGYKIGDRPIRVAKVKVSKAPTPQGKEEEIENNNE